MVCIDEKPVVSHEDTRTPLPARPGRVAQRDCAYKRCGTANVFCGVEPKAGRHFTKVTATRCWSEFADYLLKIAICYPAAVAALEPSILKHLLHGNRKRGRGGGGLGVGLGFILDRQ